MNWNDIFEYIDGYLIWKIRPARRVKVGDIAGYKNNEGYMVLRIKNKQLKVHRIIWEMHNDKIPDGMEIDHINHKRDDNRIDNLRLVNRKENSMNFSLSVLNKSGFIGVTWNKRLCKWQSNITVNGKQIYLGVFDIIDDAVKARIQASEIYGFHENHGK